MSSAVPVLQKIVEWYATEVYGRWEGPGRLPFYCDPVRIGGFAVDPAALAIGDPNALFKLLITMALYQSRRDVDIMALQRSMSRRTVRDLTRPRRLRVLISQSRCELLLDGHRFDDQCSVRRDLDRGRATCSHHPRTPCHVKDASLSIRRMGDMGKIPTSAWLHLQRSGSFAAQVEQATRDEGAPAARADRMVAIVSRVHRIGIKLATMFVSALSTPELAPGLTPWFPALDSSHLVVVDANVARVVDRLRARAGGARTYAARATWFRAAAERIDLRRIVPSWPRRSARLVQQAAYLFRSRSNRHAHHDPCASRATPCDTCVTSVCPFA